MREGCNWHLDVIVSADGVCQMSFGDGVWDVAFPLLVGTEPALYRSQVAGTGNLSPLLMESVRSQLVGTEPFPRLVGPVGMRVGRFQLAGTESQPGSCANVERLLAGWSCCTCSETSTGASLRGSPTGIGPELGDPFGLQAPPGVDLAILRRADAAMARTRK